MPGAKGEVTKDELVKPKPVSSSSSSGVTYLSEEEKKRLLDKYKGRLDPPKVGEVAEVADKCKMQ